MLRNRTKKTESALNTFLPISWYLVGLILLIVTACYQHPKNLVTLKISGQTIYLEKADTPEARQKGLSGRKTLAKNRGMLFIFDKPDTYCMWMKDTQIDLDILWLDENKVVTKIHKNVQPSTYPNSFCPEKPAKYVVELRAGMVQKLNVKH